jgi:ubiquinone/menaquinone biosynthesis C-methylase UbiE
MFNVKHYERPSLSEQTNERHPSGERAGEQRPICDYEGSSYRVDFWENQGRDYEDRAERVALRHLVPRHGTRLVDIGAGFGRLAHLYDGYEQVVLLDYSRSQLEYARQQLGDERFVYVAADIYRLPLATRAVDTAVMVRVLHHIAQVDDALAQVARITRPGGAFVLEFANKRHLKNILRYIVGRGTNPFAPEPYEFADLHYDFHPGWVHAQLEQAGFKIEARRAVSMLRAGPLKRIFSTTLLVNIDGMLQRPLAPLAPAPSQFVRSRMSRQGPDTVVDRADLFRCPACGHEPLEAMPGGHRCPACHDTWPIVNGVHVFK